MLILLAFGVLVVSTASTIFSLNVRYEDDARDGAKRLAESAARLMIARLVAKPALQGAECPSIRVSLESYDGGTGVAVLDAAVAERLGVPKSVNNLTGSGSVPGWGETVVAAETACIVGIGRYRDREVRTEAVLHVPKFPYVVSSSVPVRAEGVHVFGVRDPSALKAGFDAVPPEAKTPGNIVTNAFDSQGPALKLAGSNTLIEGNAQSRGTLELVSGAVVKGELRPLSDIAPLPRIDIGSLDTGHRAGVSRIEKATLGETSLSGFNRRSGNLAIDGGLNLDGGVLYVDGAVSIQGGLSGAGALIATGPVGIEGGGSLSGASGIAVVAGGDIHLQGTPSERAEFRGLLYAEGGLTCEHANIAGSVVVNCSSGSARVQMKSVTLAQSPEVGSVSVSVVTRTATGAAEEGDPLRTRHRSTPTSSRTGIRTALAWRP
ncbi:MAG: hypothetical protein EB084_08230 [Proteobacteria bacterium]|nr:hypothetical protein [Pseudomonadota bacterium]